MNKPLNISVEDLSEPLTYPVEAFISREYAEAEKDLLWPKIWQMAGRLEEIPEVGNFITYRRRPALQQAAPAAPARPGSAREGLDAHP